MMEDPHTHARIEAYVYGRLSEAEKTQLLDEAAQNPELADLIYQYQLEYRGMEMLFEDRLREKMRQWNAESPPKTVALPRKSTQRTWLYAAVAGILLLIIGIWAIRISQAPSVDLFALAEATAIRNANLLRGEGGIVDATDLKGIRLLDSMEYAAAITHFETLAEQQPADAIIRLLLAQSLFFEGVKQHDIQSLEKADSLFMSLATLSRPKEIRDRASWHHALILVASEAPTAKAELKEIAEDDAHLFMGDANNLLNRIP